MKSKLIYLQLAVVITLLFSCNNKKKKQTEAVLSTITEDMTHNSRNSLDWEGTYEGILPCADCEGIKSTITINKNNTYVTREKYMGKSDSVFESKGSFKWDEKGQKIMFSGKNKNIYFIGENSLVQLDNQSNKITGELADKYILIKISDKLVSRKWHLVSFKGEEIQLEEAKSERASIVFKDDNSVTGFTGCNNMSGSYKIKEDQKIKFQQLISTKKFCPEMTTEIEFLKTLHEATYYKFKDHDLVILDSEHTLLAVFKVAN